MAGNRKNAGSNVGITVARRHNGTGMVNISIAKRHNGTAWVDLFPAVSPVKLTNDNKYHAAFSDTGQATVRFRLAQAGKLRVSINGGTFDEISPFDEWLDPEDATLAVPSLYKAAYVNVSGATTRLTSFTGATEVPYNQFYQMNTTRDFELRSGTIRGQNTSVFGQLEIRKMSDHSLAASCNLNLYAEYFV